MRGLCPRERNLCADPFCRAVLGQLDAEVSGVRGIFLRVSDVWGRVESHEDGRIIRGNEGIGGVFRDEWQDGFSSRKKFGKVFESECVAAIGAIGRPLLHLQGVQGGLRAGHGGAGESSGFAEHGIGCIGRSKVVVKSEPEA